MALSWQYIAGFFDGEGSIRLANGSRTGGVGTPQLALHQSAERGKKLLVEIQEFLHQSGIRSNLQTPSMRGHSKQTKQMYRLYCYNRDGVERFIHATFPYLHIKKVECQDVLRYLTLFPKSHGNTLFRKPIPARTHCKKGHQLAEDNSYFSGRDGRCRMCKVCAKASAADRYKRLVGRPEVFAKRCKVDPAVRRFL